MIIVHADKYHRQAIPYHIVNIHDIMRIVFHRKFEKTTELLHRNPDKRIFFLRLFSFVIPTGQFHGQINRIVGFISQPLRLRQPYRIGKSGQTVPEILADKRLLRLVQLFFIDKTNFLFFQLFCQLPDNVSKLFIIPVIQLVDDLDGMTGFFYLGLHLLYVALGNTRQRSHPDTEKLIQIIAIYPHKTQAFQ